MSKKRELRHRSNPSFFNASLDEKKLKNSFFGNDTIKSTYIPQTKYNSTAINRDLTQFKKQKIFNKNISHFRQSFNQNDSSQLPFMSSLRAGQKFKLVQNKQGTICKPFQATQKSTCNQKIKKKIYDITGKNIRMTNAYYRWHNKSGINNKQATQFQCTLRDYNKSWAPNPQEENFSNIIKPIKYQDIQSPTYVNSQLICPRQRKLFNLQH